MSVPMVLSSSIEDSSCRECKNTCTYKCKYCDNIICDLCEDICFTCSVYLDNINEHIKNILPQFVKYFGLNIVCQRLGINYLYEIKECGLSTVDILNSFNLIEIKSVFKFTDIEMIILKTEYLLIK